MSIVFSQNKIKSIQLRPLGTNNYSAIVPLGKTVELSFDDLEGDNKLYSYHIKHMTYNWEPSNVFRNEYIEGFDENVITDSEQSFNTLQNYTNYKVRFPNINTKITKSGNYLISVKNINNQVVFTRKLTLYEKKTIIGVNVIPGRFKLSNDDKQNVQFTVNYNPDLIKNPNLELKAVVLQNDNWNTAIYNLKPQYFKRNQLVYKYVNQSVFWSGNEYYNFDNKQIRNSTIQISSVEKKEVYHTYLYPKEERKDMLYTYNPDINGQFIVRTIEAENNYSEADYAWVYFSLIASEIPNKKVYIYGAFNNFETTQENEMVFNKKSGMYEKRILLKQGFYNYTFATKSENQQINLHQINGSFSETENEYKVILYQMPFGENYYKVIGLGSMVINPQK